MFKPHAQTENHKSHNIGWLRAAVLGANDGIVSTASLIVGVAAANSSHENILLTGVAGLVAGAMSMAAGEFVSVSSQADTESADLKKEARELKLHPEHELEELTQIYVERGLDRKLAQEVASKLTAFDAIGSHARDELGIPETFKANPIQAAFSSAFAFAIGAALPLLLVLITPVESLILYVTLGSLIFLMVLGFLAAWIGGASMWKSAARVVFWGALALAITAGIGKLFGTVL